MHAAPFKDPSDPTRVYCVWSSPFFDGYCSFVKHSMKEAREGHLDGVKQLSSELSQMDKAITALDKQGQEAQSNLIDFLKTHHIPFQMRG